MTIDDKIRDENLEHDKYAKLIYVDMLQVKKYCHLIKVE